MSAPDPSPAEAPPEAAPPRPRTSGTFALDCPHCGRRVVLAGAVVLTPFQRLGTVVCAGCGNEAYLAVVPTD